MKLGILLVVIGVILLILTIPYSILGIIAGVNAVQQGTDTGGISSYVLVAGVVLGFVLTVIGATNIYFKK